MLPVPSLYGGYAPVCGEGEVVGRKDKIGDGQRDQEEAGRMPAQLGTEARGGYNVSFYRVRSNKSLRGLNRIPD